MGQRLAIAGLNMVYGMTNFPLNGPLMTSFETQAVDDDSFSFSITLDQTFSYDSSETTGFYLCCDVAFEECDDANGRWQLVSELPFCYHRVPQLFAFFR